MRYCNFLEYPFVKYPQTSVCIEYKPKGRSPVCTAKKICTMHVRVTMNLKGHSHEISWRNMHITGHLRREKRSVDVLKTFLIVSKKLYAFVDLICTSILLWQHHTALSHAQILVTFSWESHFNFQIKIYYMPYQGNIGEQSWLRSNVFF
jgi:hypothetical protein